MHECTNRSKRISDVHKHLEVKDILTLLSGGRSHEFGFYWNVSNHEIPMYSCLKKFHMVHQIRHITNNLWQHMGAAFTGQIFTGNQSEKAKVAL